MDTPPTLETPRLVLRAHRSQDFDALSAMWADPIVTRYIGESSNAQRSWARMLNYRGLWQLLGYGYWAIEVKATGAYAGDVGFADFRRDITPSLVGIPELGWALPVSMHGRGLGTEAVCAAVAWGDMHLECERTACIINAQNEASIRVAQKAGYAECARLEYAGVATVMFDRSKPAK